MFRVESNNIQEIYDLVSTVDTKVDAIQGAGFNGTTDSLEAIRDRMDAGLGATFNAGTDSQEAIRDFLETINTNIGNIEGTKHATIHLDPEMVIPDAGTVRYRIDVFNYGPDGMKDFDSAPTLAVVGSDAATYTTRLYTAATAGTQQATMVQIGGSGSGHYQLFFETSNADTAGTRLYFTVSGVEDSESFTYQENSEWVESISAAGIAQEATLTEIKQTTAGTYDRDTDSLEAIRNRLDAVDLEQKQTTAGTYDRDTDSQEAIRNRIDDGLGATFATATDSNEAIRDRVDVLAGAGFNASTDSLEALRDIAEEILTYGGLTVH